MEVEASKKKGDTNTRKKTHQLFAASGCAGGSNPAEEDTPVVEGSPAEGGSPAVEEGTAVAVADPSCDRWC